MLAALFIASINWKIPVVTVEVVGRPSSYWQGRKQRKVKVRFKRPPSCTELHPHITPFSSCDNDDRFLVQSCSDSRRGLTQFCLSMPPHPVNTQITQMTAVQHACHTHSKQPRPCHTHYRPPLTFLPQWRQRSQRGLPWSSA